MKKLFRKLHIGSDWQFQREDLSETAEQISNPARGWYQIYTFSAEEEPDFKELEWCLDRKDRLALILIDIGSFQNRDLDEGCMGRIQRILDFFAGEQYDIILRVVYDHEGKAMEREPSFFSQVQTHLQQLGTLLDQWKGPVFLFQGMLVGNWGEMHTSRFLSEEKLQQMAEILRAHRKSGMYLAVRRPMYFRMLHPYTKQIKEAPGDGMGLFDDGMFGSESHLGTFGAGGEQKGWREAWNREEELDFQSDLCRFVPNGGEAVYGKGYAEALTQEKILHTLRKMHVTYLNKAHDARLLDLWKQWNYSGSGVWAGRSLYDYIGAHLGYRFWIRKVTVTPLGNSGETCQVEVEIENLGFANCYQEGEVYLECRDSQGDFSARQISCDIRTWEAGEIRRIVCIVPVCDCQLFLSARRKRDGAVIRFANRSDRQGRAVLGSLRIRGA